jgi:uncharacterized RDD family membrane protein YckC
MGAILNADAVSTYSVKQALSRTKLWKYLLLRWAGAWIDLLILFFFLLIPEWALGNARYQETLWIWLVAPILYFPVLEGVWGRTIGKLITGTVVVDISGNPPGIWKAVLRTLVRIVEINPLAAGGVIAGIAVCMSQNRQRLGDMLAHTFVVRVKDLDDPANVYFGYLRMLIYPVQFDPNPSESVERAFTIISRDAPQFIPDKFIRAIDLGLQSNVTLSELIPQDHPEAVIREYLTAMRARLKQG